MAESKPLPPWAWMILGMIIGLFVAFVWYLDRQLPTEAEAGGSGAKVEAVGTVKKPTFDFYTILPEMETVVIDPPKAEPLTGESPPEAPPEVADSSGILLQVASFQGADEAERLKARLALLGLEAHVQSVQVDSQGWHRVRLGPFAAQLGYQEARNRLAENGFEYIQIRSR